MEVCGSCRSVCDVATLRRARCKMQGARCDLRSGLELGNLEGRLEIGL